MSIGGVLCRTRRGVAAAAICFTLAASAACAAEPRASRAQDHVQVRQEGDRSVVEVYRMGGIGGAQVRAPRSGWPPAVVVRLHGFPELESFRARSSTVTLLCELSRPEGRPAHRDCRLGSARVDAIERTPEYFEIRLPFVMLTGDSGPIEVRWVDRWR
jgi:hypothetical protein